MTVALQVKEDGIFTGANENAIISGDLFGWLRGGFDLKVAGKVSGSRSNERSRKGDLVRDVKWATDIPN